MKRTKAFFNYHAPLKLPRADSQKVFPGHSGLGLGSGLHGVTSGFWRHRGLDISPGGSIMRGQPY